MSDVRIYVVAPLSLVTKNYVRTGGHMVVRTLREVRESLRRFPSSSKIIWSVVSEQVLFSDSRGSCISADVASWRDLQEEDLHVFMIEEKMEGPRARELSLQPLHPMGRR